MRFKLSTAVMRKNLRVLLAEAGHEVVAEASNGMEAYREYAKHKPDLVTMDITIHFEIESLTDEELRSFSNYILMIKEASGTVGIVCPNLRLIRQMKAKDADLYAKIYTDIKEIVM